MRGLFARPLDLKFRALKLKTCNKITVYCTNEP
jgi:hypothetical protein